MRSFERPAKAGRGIGLPALHLDHAIVDIELERADKPQAELAKRQTMPHRQRPGADETFPAGAQGQAFDGPANGVRPVQYPHRLAMFRGRLEHVTQGRDERVDAATEILQVDEDHVACIHHRIRRPAHVAVKAEDRECRAPDP